LLIIKENIFNDANTGSNLGGRAQEWQGSTKNREKPHPYPIPSAAAPLLHLFSAFGVCSARIFI